MRNWCSPAWSQLQPRHLSGSCFHCIDSNQIVGPFWLMASSAAAAVARALVLQLLDTNQGSMLSMCTRARIIQHCWQLLPPKSTHTQVFGSSCQDDQHGAEAVTSSRELQNAASQEGASELQLLWSALAEQQYILALELLMWGSRLPADCQWPELPQKRRQQPQTVSPQHSLEPAGTCSSIQLADMLLHQLGYRYRLADALWAAATSPSSAAPLTTTLDAASLLALKQPMVLEASASLPCHTITALQQAFCTSSPYWWEHQYHNPSTPFFSYIHCLSAAPQNIVDVAAQQLHSHPLLQPLLNKATHVEWWAHLRSGKEGSSEKSSTTSSGAWAATGHQLHFDCDERRLRKGQHAYKLCHPLYSSVLYLDMPQHAGPTLVLDQIPGQPDLATRGWLIWPDLGRYALFPGNLLHGVLPEAQSPGQAVSSPVVGEQGTASEVRTGHTTQVSTPVGCARITLMLAWWCDPDPTDSLSCLQNAPSMHDGVPLQIKKGSDAAGEASNACNGSGMAADSHAGNADCIDGRWQPWMKFPAQPAACRPGARAAAAYDSVSLGLEAVAEWKAAAPANKRMRCGMGSHQPMQHGQYERQSTGQVQHGGDTIDVRAMHVLSSTEKQQGHVSQRGQHPLQRTEVSTPRWAHRFQHLMQHAASEEAAAHAALHGSGFQAICTQQASQNAAHLPPAYSPAWTEVTSLSAACLQPSCSGAIQAGPLSGLAEALDIPAGVSNAPENACADAIDMQTVVRQDAGLPDEVIQQVQCSLPDLRFFLPCADYINRLYPADPA